jgi:hypothetical protein
VTSPTNELRTAAAYLRELIAADGVHPGPWTITPRYRKGTKVIVQYDVHKPPLPGSNRPGFKAIHPGRTDALYGAVMHPGVGAALVELLETAAEYVVEDSPAHPTHLVRALAVARAINTATEGTR